MNKLWIVVIAVFIASTALANQVKIQAFGSAALAVTDIADPKFNWDTNKDPDFFRNTKFGLNFRGNISDDFSFAAQLLAKQWPTDTYHEQDLKLDYAQAKYSPITGLSLYLGKIKFPVWLISDYEEVNALHPWIEPPVELYFIANGLSSMNGAMVGYQHIVGDFELSADVYYGDATYIDQVTPVVAAKGYTRKLHGATFKIEHSNLTLRGSYAKSDYTKTDAFISGFNTGSTVNEYTFKSLGVKANYEDLWLFSEYGKVDVTNLNKIEGFYATLGYDFEYITPHLTYASYEYEHLVEQVYTEVAGVTKVYLPTYKSKQRSIAVGLNFKATPTSVFKIDYKRITVPKSNKYFTTTTYIPTTTNTYSGPDLSNGLFSSHPDKTVNMINLAYQFYF